jgi:hypothetical protein
MDGDRMLNLAGGGLVVFVVGTVVLVGFLVATGQPADSGEAVPAVNWSVDRVNDTHVRVAHVGGPPVDAVNLTVTVDGAERSTGWSGRVVRGRSTTLSAQPDAVVRVFYGVGDQRTLLVRERA